MSGAKASSAAKAKDKKALDFNQLLFEVGGAEGAKGQEPEKAEFKLEEGEDASFRRLARRQSIAGENLFKLVMDNRDKIQESMQQGAAEQGRGIRTGQHPQE